MNTKYKYQKISVYYYKIEFFYYMYINYNKIEKNGNMIKILKYI